MRRKWVVPISPEEKSVLDSRNGDRRLSGQSRTKWIWLVGDCPECNGSGQLEDKFCPSCLGSGTIAVLVGDA